MKLYSLNNSPFAAPVRLAIYAKALPIEIVAPPGGFRSAEYKQICREGSIPYLVLDDGMGILESTTIMEYLEDEFPEPSLLPGNAKQRALARLIQRSTELYVLAPMYRLFFQLNPTRRNEHTVRLVFDKLERGLDRVEALHTGETFAAGSALTVADCHLAPTLWGAEELTRAFGRPGNIVGARAKLGRYLRATPRHPAIERVLEELRTAHDASIVSGR